MNCKQGDLAVVVRVRSQVNAWMMGMVVKCKAFETQHNGTDGWITGDPVRSPDSYPHDFGWVADFCLMPIRPGDDPDETLSWCDVPSKVTA